MRASNRLSHALGCSGFFVMRLLELLKCREARVRKSLLMMLRYTFKAISTERQLSFMLKHNLFPIIKRMADREAQKGIVIVARVANKLQADLNLCIEAADLKWLVCVIYRIRVCKKFKYNRESAHLKSPSSIENTVCIHRSTAVVEPALP